MEKLQFVPEDYFRRLKPEEIFPDGADRPLEVDLGCGDGSFLLEMARRFPDRNFLGVERLKGRVRKVCRKAGRSGLENLKVLRLESAYTVEWLLPESSVSRVFLLFPDPWPKKRHGRRRIVTPDFLGHVARILVAGGEFVFKTDDREYFELVSEMAAQFQGFTELEWYPEEVELAGTDFEAQWTEAGREIFELRYGR